MSPRKQSDILPGVDDEYDPENGKFIKRLEVTVDKIGLLIGRGGSKVRSANIIIY
jgi:hypothetical protein